MTTRSDSSGAGAAGAVTAVPAAFAPLGELGRGAHTVVYKVRRTRDGAEYALKLLESSGPAGDGRSAAGFRREAALLACLDHPALARVHEVGESRGQPYLVMDYVDGRRLTEVLDAGPLAERRLVALGLDLAGALVAAHRAGVVHRDVKPDNILVLADGRAKLIDFGLAARAGAGQVEGAAAGTFLYSAPEQTGMLRRPVDGRADLYALGVVLFECATGEPPFSHPEVGELLRLHAAAPPPDPRTLRPELSDGLAAVIGRLLAKDPDDRYQDGSELLADLGSLADPSGRVGDPVPAGAGTLVGRQRELRELVGAWAGARAGRGSVALISGAPGSGKSRLAGDLLAAALSDRRLVLSGKCAPDDGVPMGPLRAAVDRYVDTVQRLPEPARTAAVERLRAAAGSTAALLRPLSPRLAALLDAPELSAEDRQDQVTTAVASFLVGLARAAGGAVLHLDDVQWLDDSSRRVLGRLAAELPGASLLLVATARDGDECGAQVEAFRAALTGAVVTDIDLVPLTDDEVAELATAQLGGHPSTELAAQLARRAGGNPFTVLEYLRAVIDAGLLRPSWGRWLLDAGGLDDLELPGDVLDLVLARAEGLGRSTRVLLAAGAAMGTRFTADLLAEACEVDQEQALTAVTEAVAHRLAEPREGGYAFLHDRIREGLLADLDEPVRRRLHQRIAEALDRQVEPADAGADRVYAVARHYIQGERGRTPARLFQTCWSAGRLALSEHAPAEAFSFLEQAAAAGIVLNSRCHQDLGVACMRTGRLEQAGHHLTSALEIEGDPVRRAVLLQLLARVQVSSWDPDGAQATVSRGLHELGHPLPGNRLVLALSTMALFIAGVVAGRLGRWSRMAEGDRRDRYRVRLALHDIGSEAGAASLRYDLSAMHLLRGRQLINRAGPCVQTISIVCGLGGLAQFIGWRRRAERIFEWASQTAARLGDPKTMARVAWSRGAARLVSRADEGEAWRQVLEDHGRWLDLVDYVTAAGNLCGELLLHGHARAASAWYERACSLGAGHLLPGLAEQGVVIPAMLGRGAEGAVQLEAIRQSPADEGRNPMRQVSLAATATQFALEQGELGEPFEQAVAAFERLGLRPVGMLSPQLAFWVWRAYGRLAQCQAAPDEERAARLAAAEAAVGALRRVAKGRPRFQAHAHAARGSLLQLRGEHEAALDELESADRLGQRLDMPLVIHEAGRARARVWRALDNRPETARQARTALQLAIEHGWEQRARWVRTEFQIAEPLTVHSNTSVPTRSAGDSPHRRRLEAIQQVSRIAASVVEPRELARAVLDETLHIVGAERAVLFLADGDGRLEPYVGRAADGTELDRLTGYGSTLVGRVHETGEALVVTGTEEGAALGSQSAVVHGLRRILVAPLRLEGRPLGVVYLDSRLARGVFTPDDVDLLVAITSHIALSLETARAAQLEAAVQAERRQRDLAETLRDSMIAISGTLDPDEVLGRLLAAAVRILPGVAGLILRPAADHRAVVAAAHGDAAASLLGRRLDLAGDAPLTRLLEAEAPVLGGLGTDRSAELGALLRAAGAWIGVPLQARGERVGVLLVTTSLGDRFGDSQVNIGGALAGQAMVAYDNARLFARAESSLAELRHAHKLEAVGRLAAGIAHEIDTPIQCISDNTRFLVDSFAGLSRVLDAYRAALRAEDVTVADGRLDELARLEAEVGLDLLSGEAPAAATRTLDGAAHIARIVLAMKTLGHPDDDELTEADLNQALETTVTVARGELEDVAEVELDLAPLPPVSCYLSDLHQVFLNLLVNAAHAVAQTGRRGTIRVATRLQDDQVVVEIGDDGAGIPDAVKPVGQGTGRGLSLAHATVVDRHGGSITVDSRNGQGTTFIIRLHLHGPTREPAGRLPR